MVNLIELGVTVTEDTREQLYTDQLEIFTEGDFVGVRGDLHNYKRRNRILWIMSGGKHGKDLPTG